LGPVIKLGERSLKLSAKIVHAVLTKSIKTVKRHESWFHFGAQPMRFSIREFHMVTGLKCSGEAREPREETERFKWDFLKGRTHTVKDVEKQLRNTREDASDERFCLAMLLLIESILLQKSLLDGGTTFTLDYVKIAQDMDVLMTYPWGRTAYNLLLKSLQRAVDKSLDKNNYDLQGFPMAFLIWILESVPLLQYAFSQVVPILSVQPSTPIFLCEKYLQIASPQLIDVLLIEIKDHVSFYIIFFLFLFCLMILHLKANYFYGFSLRSYASYLLFLMIQKLMFAWKTKLIKIWMTWPIYPREVISLKLEIGETCQ